MQNRMKEDEKIERAIRSLLKLPENRRCINCCSLGPQYVCTTFLTFVCTNCSGIHREFTHRVKSVSMAKFTAEEVSALQVGGNERARKIYFKEWDPKRNSYPDGSNLLRLRDFIKNVYVDRKYAGEGSDNLPRLRLSDKEESYESKKVSAHSVGSRSPHYEDRYERSNNERARSAAGRGDDRAFKFYYDERRSPRYAQENSRSGGFRRNPVRFEVVDDRYRDDGFGGGRRYEGHNFSNMESKGNRSADGQKNKDRSRSPIVHPIRDILGDNTPHLHVGDVSKVIDRKDADGSAHSQKTASSGNLQSLDGNPVEQKRRNPESLIDFSTDFETSDATEAPKLQQMPPSNDGGMMSSSEFSSKEKASQAPSANPLESLLFELSAPSVGPGGNNPEVPSNNKSPSTASGGKIPADSVPEAAPVGMMSMVPYSFDAFSASTTNVPVQHCNGGLPHSAPDISGDSTTKFPQTQQLSGIQQHQPPSSPAAYNSSNAQQTTVQAVTLNNQSWTFSSVPNTQGPSSSSIEQSFQDVSKPAQDTMAGVGPNLHPVETKSIGRKELPVDLFTTTYSLAPQQAPGWQSGPSRGMGYGIQYYPNARAMGTISYSAKSTNPFDLNSETNPVQAPQFPSMASMQGELPNMSAATGLFRASSPVDHSSGLMAPQSPSDASSMASQSPSFASAMPSGAYMGQQVHINMPPSGLQGVGGFDTDGDAFSSLNVMQQPTRGYPAANSPNSSSSSRGNPFG